jgi:hypothetical protein
MATEDLLVTSPTRPTALGSYRGTCRGRTAYARETVPGSWQVKIHDPTNRLAGHDGWLLIGTGWPTLADACAATGLA